MISGSKSGSTAFLGGASSARSATGVSTGAVTALVCDTATHLREERFFLGEDLRIGVVVERDRLHRALTHAHAAALTGGRRDCGLLHPKVYDRNFVGADAHAGETGRTLVLV